MESYKWDVTVLTDNAALISEGLARTLLVVLITTIGGLTLGVISGAVSAHRIPIITPVVECIGTVVRNTPLLVQIFLVYFGLPVIGITLSGFAAAAVTLVIWCAAFASENVRASIEAVDRNQYRAGQALGMSPGRTYVNVIVPQGLRLSIASNKNTVVSTLKNSSLMVAVGFAELTSTIMKLVSTTFRVYELFLFMGVVYLALVWISTQLLTRLEQRLAVN